MVVSRWNGILASVKDRTRGTTLLVLVTAFALFVKCVLFSYMAYHLVIISSLWKMPHIFGDYYFPKIAAAIFFASLLFVIKRKYWYFLILFIVDAWCVANLCYFRISGFMVDAYALSMVGNMDGFWGSSLLTCLISSCVGKTTFFLFRLELPVETVVVSVFLGLIFVVGSLPL